MENLTRTHQCAQCAVASANHPFETDWVPCEACYRECMEDAERCPVCGKPGEGGLPCNSCETEMAAAVDRADHKRRQFEDDACTGTCTQCHSRPAQGGHSYLCGECESANEDGIPF